GPAARSPCRRRLRRRAAGGRATRRRPRPARRARRRARRRAAAQVPRAARPRLRNALRLQKLGDGIRRLRALLQPAAHLLLVELDEGGLVLGVVAPDDLDELAVTRR